MTISFIVWWTTANDWMLSAWITGQLAKQFWIWFGTLLVFDIRISTRFSKLTFDPTNTVRKNQQRREKRASPNLNYRNPDIVTAFLINLELGDENRKKYKSLRYSMIRFLTEDYDKFLSIVFYDRLDLEVPSKQFINSWCYMILHCIHCAGLLAALTSSRMQRNCPTVTVLISGLIRI